MHSRKYCKPVCVCLCLTWDLLLFISCCLNFARSFSTWNTQWNGSVHFAQHARLPVSVCLCVYLLPVSVCLCVYLLPVSVCLCVYLLPVSVCLSVCFCLSSIFLSDFQDLSSFCSVVSAPAPVGPPSAAEPVVCPPHPAVMCTHTHTHTHTHRFWT